MPDRTRRSRRSCAIGRVTSTVVLVTIPWRWAARMTSLTPRVSPKSSAFTISRRTSVPQGSLDQETLDRARRVPPGQRALGVEGADVVEPLVADPGEGLGLAGDHLRREPRRLHLRERGLPAEKAEDREGEPAARLEVGAGARDHAVEDLPAVDAAVVGGGDWIVAVAPGRRRHLGRVRADEVEALARDGRVAVAEPRVDRDAVQEGVLPDRGDRRRQHVGRHHARAGPRRQDRGEPEAGADLEHALARTHAEVPLEEARAGLGRLDTVGDAEEAARDGVEEDAVVGHYAVYTARMSAWAFAAL